MNDTQVLSETTTQALRAQATDMKLRVLAWFRQVSSCSCPSQANL